MSNTATSSQAMSQGRVYVLHHDNPDPALLPQLLNRVKSHSHGHHSDTDDGKPPVCLGVQSTALWSAEKVLTPCEYLVHKFRQHSMHRNERELLLSEEDQLIAVQLCIAAKNKQLCGDFDVEVSKVLEFKTRLEKSKLSCVTEDTTTADEVLNSSFSLSTSGSECDFENFLVDYKSFLEANNLLDVMDLIQRVKQEKEKNEELKHDLDEQIYVYLQPPQGTLQHAQLQLLLGEKPIYWIRIAESLSDDLDEQTLDPEQILIDETSYDKIVHISSMNSSRPSDSSVTENFVEKVFLGYIHLLVNSRSEIALARVFNNPERGLDHKAFTDLKHEAKHKGLSMYQTAISFVMKIRLGGRSYAPDANHRLINHVKGLAEFTDLLNKLQTALEEDTNPRSAVTRVLNVLKTTLLKCRDVRKQSVEAVKERLQLQSDWIMNQMDSAKRDSPQRTAATGGSQVGRQALKALRWMLDHSMSQQSCVSHLVSLTDVLSSQTTPLKFSSVLSHFRSPMECSPEARENKSLVQRMKDKFPVKKASRRPAVESCLSWAQPVHDSGVTGDLNSSILTGSQGEYIPSKTIVHPRAGCTVVEPSSANQVTESLLDQENTDSTMHSRVKETTHKVAPVSRKRLLEDQTTDSNPGKKTKLQSSQPPSQKSKATKTSKTNKKKALPLGKGQQTLSAFFRV